jgi:AAA+ superfamily predicted ATPase
VSDERARASAASGLRLPRWAEDLARYYTAGVASVFLIHGNLHDLVPVYGADGKPGAFVSLETFLAGQLFGRRDTVVLYDRGAGLVFGSGEDGERRQSMRRDFLRTLEAMDTVLGTDWSRKRLEDPKVVFDVLDRYILAKAAAPPAPEGEAGGRRSLAALIRYAETIAPAVEVGWLTGDLGANLLKILNWANDPAVRRADVTICLLVENLAELNRRVVENPFVAKIEIPLPDEDERREYIEHLVATDARLAALPGLDPRALAREANGLTLVGVSQVVGQTVRAGKTFDLVMLRRAKKDLIEKQCFGLVDFVEPRFGLDMVVSPPSVKERLQQDARLIREGRQEALPMGYLICGVLGTGKTFTATCFAGSIGIPAIVFRNLREKWVGSSEGNMQKVLAVVRALGPVVVIVDEADAALGNRAAEGDSGTSGRMFAMISSQMSDTAYRGKVIWMLLTCRPDLLPVDLKRQGRCEVHIPLFVPQTEDERREMLLAMARKNKVTLDPERVPPIPEGLSGADIESVVVQCLREAVIAGLSVPTPEMLGETLSRIVSPDYSLQKELQELVAVREATDLRFLPPRYRELRRDPARAAEMERRIQELTLLLGERG